MSSQNSNESNFYNDFDRVKEIVHNHFQNRFGNEFDNRHHNAINRINQQCINLSSEGVNLLANTNLVTGREYNMMNNPNIQYNIPIHMGFHSNYTGKPLIISIIDDRNLANNHLLHSNESYNKIVEIMNEFN